MYGSDSTPRTPGEIHVGIIAPPYLRCPPVTRGGIERDVDEVIKAVGKDQPSGTEEDIRLHLFLPQGSDFYGDKVDSASHYTRPLWELGLPQEELHKAYREARRSLLAHVQRWQGKIDLLHVFWEDHIISKELSGMTPAKLFELSNTPDSANSLPIIKSLSHYLNPYPQWSPGEKIHYTALSYTHAQALTAAAKVALANSGLPLPLIEVLPYGVSYEGIKPSDFKLTQTSERPTLPLLQQLQDDGQDCLVHVAGVQIQKSQLTGVKAFQRAKQLGLKNVKLVIVGEPDSNSPEANEYAQQLYEVAAADPDIYLFGGANEKEKWELFRFALGSLYCSSFEDSDYLEAYCRSLVEGPLVGTPVIGYSSDTFRELMDEGITGLEFNNIDEAAEKILQLALLSPEQYTLKRQQCYARARQVMGSDRFTQQILQLYRYMGRGFPAPCAGITTWGEFGKYTYVPFNDPQRAAKVRGREYNEEWYERQLRKWFHTNTDLLRIARGNGLDFIRRFMSGAVDLNNA